MLVNTRKRRSNAGSRLKQLLSAEERPDEDDDVDLLFVEDDNDGEYQSASDEEPEEASEAEQESQSDTDAPLKKKRRSREATVEADDEDVQEGEDEGEDEGDTTTSSEAEPEDNDEMFSDSSEESSEEDSDAGEKELQKAERAKKRERQKKQKHQIPAIKKASTTLRKPKRVYEAPKADTLLSESRRQSSRQTAVQNKLDLVEKLKEEEQRRSSLKPVQKIEYVEMTQEERLAEAIETEKYNISTLNKYQEQEVDRAKRRREMMMNKRRKLTDVMTIKSCIKFVEIEEEREYEKFLLTRDVMKKKDRRGRKSEKQKREEEEERLKAAKMRERWEMLNNPEKSYLVQDITPQEETGTSLETTPQVETGDQTNEEKGKQDGDNNDATLTGVEVKKEAVEEIDKEKEQTKEEKKDEELEEKQEEKQEEEEKKEEEKQEEEKKEEEKKEGEEDENVHEKENEDQKREDTATLTPENATPPKLEDKVERAASEAEGEALIGLSPGSDDDEVILAKPDSFAVEVIKTEQANDTPENSEVAMKEASAERSSTTVDASGDVAMIDADATPDATPGATAEVNKDESTEGTDKETDVKMEDAATDIPTPATDATPEVKTVKFADEEEARKPIVTKPTPPPPPPKIIYEGPKQKVGANFIAFENSYKIPRLRGILFGEQSLLGAHRRTTEVEPLVRIRQDPSLTTTSLDPSSSLKLPDLSVLDSFPEFGNFEKVHREVRTVETVKDTKIVLKTEAPTGIYLPSGQKKMCLITGKPAMYFDPKTGMPYADVESYKVIKEIQDGTWMWGQGGYVATYHAKGVPPGFADS